MYPDWHCIRNIATFGFYTQFILKSPNSTGKAIGAERLDSWGAFNMEVEIWRRDFFLFIIEQLEFGRAYIFLATTASFCSMEYSDLEILVYKLPFPEPPVIDDRF